MQGLYLTQLAPRCQSGILLMMEIEPLKIPAFMRKKSFIKKETPDSFKAPVEPSTSTLSVPDRPRRRFISPTPIPAPSTLVVPRSVKPEPVFTPVGVVTHYLDKISVVIVKLGADVRVGDRLVLNGEKGPFRQKLKSMQINRQNVEVADRGKEVGIKVSKKAIVGEMVYVVG